MYLRVYLRVYYSLSVTPGLRRVLTKEGIKVINIAGITGIPAGITEIMRRREAGFPLETL